MFSLISHIFGISFKLLSGKMGFDNSVVSRITCITCRYIKVALLAVANLKIVKSFSRPIRKLDFSL